MSNYLRNRPFMVITYRYTLAPNQQSNRPGFGDTANWQAIESVDIVDRVSSKKMNDAYVIIDILERKTIKCREDIDFDVVYDMMIQRHITEIAAALKDWVRKHPNDLAKIEEFITAIKIKTSTTAKNYKVTASIKEVIEKNLFEKNDAETRNNIVNMILDSVKGEELVNISVICDETNNNEETADSTELYVDIKYQLEDDGPVFELPVEVTIGGVPA